MPAITKPNQHFEALTYTGNGSTQNITGLNFQPNLVWIKGRSLQSNHRLYDGIRGATNATYSDLTDAEAAESTGLTAFLSGGFSLGSQAGHNSNGNTYVGWNWKAGSTTVTNTTGSVSAQVSANPTAGFSVITYTSPNTTSDETIGHGLGATPQFIITKNRDRSFNWDIWHKNLSSGNGLVFATDAQSSGRWSTTTPTSSVFTVKYNYEHYSTDRYVAYCWAPIEGYSAFGSYTGNGSANGPFVYTGFKPAYVIIKQINASATWFCFDNKREPSNVNDSYLMAQSNAAEDANNNTIEHDFVSNGFKSRATSAGTNQNNGTYIYAAFAENPFKYANAK